MKFLADMCVDVRVVRWLREQRYDAVHLRDEGLHKMPNGQIFEKAINENRIVITFDLDFGEIAAFTRGEKASVILFRLQNTRISNVLDRLAYVLENSSEALSKGAVIVVEEFRHRIRYLPIGEK